MKRKNTLLIAALVVLTAMPSAHGMFSRMRAGASRMANKLSFAGTNAFGKFKTAFNSFNAQPRAVKFLAAGFGTSTFAIYKQYQAQQELFRQLDEQRKRADNNEELNKLLNLRAELQPIVNAESRENQEQQLRHEKERKLFELELANKKTAGFDGCMRGFYTTRSTCSKLYNI